MRKQRLKEKKGFGQGHFLNLESCALSYCFSARALRPNPLHSPHLQPPAFPLEIHSALFIPGGKQDSQANEGN